MQLTVEGLNAVTREYRLGIPSIEEITDNDWFLEVLRMQGGLTVQGGSVAQEQIKIPRGRTGGYYSGDDSIELKSRLPYTYAQYPWSHQYEDATLFKTDILKCSGPEAVVNLIDDAKKDAFQRMILCHDENGNDEGIAVDIFNSLTTAQAASSKRFVGIGHMLSNDRELGGITSGTSNSHIDMWNPHLVDFDKDGTPVALTIPKIAAAIKYAKWGNNMPNVGLYTPGLNEKLESIFQGYVRYRSEELKQMRGGLENVLIYGVPFTEERRLMTEANETSLGSRIALLDMSSMKIVFHSDDNFVSSDWEKLQKQKGYFCTVDLTMTMTFRRPRTNALLFDIDASAT